MKISRKAISVSSIFILCAVLVYAFWPRPVTVDAGLVERRPMVVAISEEGRTRVSELYVVSTPVSGRLLRTAVKVGDRVIAGETLLGRLLPSVVVPLNERDQAQALAAVDAAQAGLRQALAGRERAQADRDLAERQLARMRELVKSASVSVTDLDYAVREAQTAAAALQDAAAAIDRQRAEVARLRALVKNYRGESSEAAADQPSTPILAPVSGRVLRLLEKSEALVAGGTPLMEIGDVDKDLEVVVELLSADAVRVAVGQQVEVFDWGGAELLHGTVSQVEPAGFTKLSALGVEEQRVKVVVRLSADSATTPGLGHGFRVETRIIVWEDRNALVVPASALFRTTRGWAVFVVSAHRTSLRQVEIGRNNGTDAQVLGGIKEGERVVLYPAAGLSAGTRVKERSGR